MSIQKKSLISSLKSAKKANVATAHEVDAKGSKVESMRLQHNKFVSARRGVTGKSLASSKTVTAKRGIVAKSAVTAKRGVTGKSIH